MSIVIERHDITRIVEVDFPDGRDIVGEALEFDASCGCVIIYGLRWKKGLMEKCCMAHPCEKHPKLRENVLAMGERGHIMYDEDVDKAVSWAILFAEADE